MGGFASKFSVDIFSTYLHGKRLGSLWSKSRGGEEELIKSSEMDGINSFS